MYSDEQLQKMNLWEAPSLVERLAHDMPELHRHYCLPQSGRLSICGFKLQNQFDGVDVGVLPICAECEFKLPSYQQETPSNG